MKKRFVALITVILAFVLGLSVFSGCNLVTRNSDRDLEQVVATVNIDSDKFQTEKISKKDMIMGYLNYGYQYAGSYTQAQIFQMILDSLVNERILLQNAMVEFETPSSALEKALDVRKETIPNATNFVENADKDEYTVERYLTADDIRDAEYEVIKSINTLIESYEDTDDELKSDTMWATVRAIPTGATNEEIELEDGEKDTYIQKGILKGIDTSGQVTDADRYKAYNQVLKVLKANGLLGENVVDIETSTYYTDVLKSQKEYALREKYEKELGVSYRSSITFADLSSRYTDLYEKQSVDYADATAFATALSSATADSPILFNGADGYGYVYNLLLGASSEQTNSIGEIDSDAGTNEYNQARKNILAATYVKDQRATWIQSGYDFDGKKFTGDYTFAKDPDNSLEFYGETYPIKDADPLKGESARYGVKSVKDFYLTEFIAEMDSYLGINGSNATIEENVDNNVYRKANVTSGTVAEYDAKINELLFAFSTDPGSLNTYKGYVIAPEPDLDGKDQWVIEFADAGRKLLKMGGNSYIIVASDYGYHILFYSEYLTAGGIDDLEDYLDSEFGAKDWGTTEFANMIKNWDDADDTSYLYKLITAVADTTNKINNKHTATVNEYRYVKDGCVVINEGAYSDLMSE